MTEWAEVNPTCSSGVEQSPVDLPDFIMAKRHDNALNPEFNPIQAMVEDNGHVLEWKL